MRRSLLIAALIVGGVLAGSLLWVRNYMAAPLSIPEQGYRLAIAPGTSWSAVARHLADDGITPWAEVLRACGQLTGQAGRIQAGEYDLIPGTTPASLLEQLVAGKVVLHKLTIVEGWSVAEIVSAIRADAALKTTLEPTRKGPGSATLAADLARDLNLPWPSAEGAFLPETYLFASGTTDREVLARAHAALRDRLDKAWAARRPDLPLKSPYELLVLASIVERETALASERPQIAGVFIRRLKQGMRLQTDPTVIYGLGSRFDGNLTRVDLATDSPWNTYTRDGLPPTPIATASRAAIDAASRPADGDALFFVASAKGDGSHRFTATLQEHEAAVRAYLAELRRRDSN
jgi:UPF0755 protein